MNSKIFIQKGKIYKMKKDSYAFIKSHNLVNRIYDMINYLGIVKNPNNDKNIKKFIRLKLQNIEYVESLAKYFEKKLKKNKNDVELRCNLQDLIYDLDYLKLYL